MDWAIFMRRQGLLILATALAIVVSLFCGSLQQEIRPAFALGSYRFIDSPVTESITNQPFHFRRQNCIAEFNIAFDLPRFHAQRFLLRIDDCLENLSVNGRPIRDLNYPQCVYPSWIEVNENLVPGRNSFQFQVRNFGGQGGWDLMVSPTDWRQLAIRAGLVTTLLLYGVFILVHFRVRRSWHLPLALGFAGIFVRCLYFWVTPYDVRAHDLPAHLEYIDYVARSFVIPPPNQCFVCWHAPLYYFVAAAWQWCAQHLGRPGNDIISDLTLFSLALSLFTLGVGVLLGNVLFAQKSNRELAFFCASLAVIPGLVFHAVPVNDDSLQCLFFFLILLVLLSWWNKPTLLKWYSTVVLVSLSALVKANGLVFLPVMLCLSLVRRGATWRNKTLHTVFGCLVFFLLTGWYYYYRHVVQAVVSPLGPLDRLPQVVVVDNHWQDYLTFNPWAVLEITFNNPYSPGYRRDIVWEFFFRSIYLGESGFPENMRWISVLMLYSGLLLLPLIVRGIWRESAGNFYAQLPLAATMTAFLLATIAFRIFYPLVPAQDFRYVTILVVPFSYYCIKGAKTAESRQLSISEALIVQHLVCCLLFYFALYLNP
jgi:hypothetical protein